MITFILKHMVKILEIWDFGHCVVISDKKKWMETNFEDKKKMLCIRFI